MERLVSREDELLPSAIFPMEVCLDGFMGDSSIGKHCICLGTSAGTCSLKNEESRLDVFLVGGRGMKSDMVRMALVRIGSCWAAAFIFCDDPESVSVPLDSVRSEGIVMLLCDMRADVGKDLKSSPAKVDSSFMVSSSSEKHELKFSVVGWLVSNPINGCKPALSWPGSTIFSVIDGWCEDGLSKSRVDEGLRFGAA